MINSVNSFDEVKNCPVMFGTSELFMDNNKDVFYVKAVDTMGKYTISTYKFEQIENERPLTPNDFVSKEQFEQLSSKIDFLIKELGGSSNG